MSSAWHKTNAMNETQKTLIIVGLVLFLLVIAHHLLFVEQIKNDLLDAEYELKMEEFSYYGPQEPGDEIITAGVDEIVALEHKLKIHLLLRFFILLGGLAALIASYFFRNKRREGESEDEWDEESFEDECEEDS